MAQPQWCQIEQRSQLALRAILWTLGPSHPVVLCVLGWESLLCMAFYLPQTWCWCLLLTPAETHGRQGSPEDVWCFMKGLQVPPSKPSLYLVPDAERNFALILEAG